MRPSGNRSRKRSLNSQNPTAQVAAPTNRKASRLPGQTEAGAGGGGGAGLANSAYNGYVGPALNLANFLQPGPAAGLNSGGAGAGGGGGGGGGAAYIPEWLRQLLHDPGPGLGKLKPGSSFYGDPKSQESITSAAGAGSAHSSAYRGVHGMPARNSRGRVARNAAGSIVSASPSQSGRTLQPALSNRSLLGFQPVIPAEPAPPALPAGIALSAVPEGNENENAEEVAAVAPPPSPVAEEAGVGAAAVAEVPDTLVDCRESVLKFMRDIMKLPGPFTEPYIDDFMKTMSAQSDINAPNDNVLDYLKRLDTINPSELAPLIVNGEVIKGSFGRIYLDKDKPTKYIWKELQYVMQRSYTYHYAQTILQEAFMQYVLSDINPDAVVKIFEICRHVNELMEPKLYIRMEFATRDLFGEFKRNLILETTAPRRTWSLPPQVFLYTMRPLLETMVKLNKDFNFVHRDLKSNNVVVIDVSPAPNPNLPLHVPPTLKVKLIDFGMSCMDMRIGEVVYRFITHSGNYEYGICNPQMDMVILLLEIELTFGNYFRKDGFIDTFYNNVDVATEKGFYDAITEKRGLFPRGKEHHASYNKDGSMTGVGRPAYKLTPEFVLEILNMTFTHMRGAPLRGGRRSRRRTAKRRTHK